MALNETNGIAPFNVTMLPAVNPDRKNCSICVRVIRMWRVLNSKRNNDPMSIELVLMDSEGDTIHASIKKYLFYKFEKDIRKDSVYYMSNFDVVPNLGEYRSTRHDYKIDFEFGTKIWEAASNSVPAARFVFTPPALCFEPEFESDYLVDIIGVLTEVGAAREFVRNGANAKSKLLDIELDNNGYRFKVRLFGSLVDELNSFLSSGETVNTVLVILFVKLKTWEGPPILQTSMYSSKLIFNPDISEAAALRSRMVESSESPIGGLSQLQETKSKSIEDNFLNDTPKVTIEEIKNSNEDLMDKFTETAREATSDVNSNSTTAIFGISSDNEETSLSKRHCNKVPKFSTYTSPSSSIVNADREEMKKFADWILQVDGDITIPDDLLILGDVNPLQSLIDFAYPSLLTNMNNEHFFEERSILAPRRESVEHVNDYVLSLIAREEMEYLSWDSSCQFDEASDFPGELVPPEFLNIIKCSDIPDHKLKLKVGVPVMLMRTIDQSSGLCNGTRLLVNKLERHVIGATVLTGKNKGKQTLLPRMDFVSSDRGLPFKFKRRQFPIALCFAMTIDKCQEQSLSHVAIYFPEPVCNHCQLYGALSQVKSRKGLKLLILGNDKNACRTIKTVVY